MFKFLQKKEEEMEIEEEKEERLKIQEMWLDSIFITFTSRLDEQFCFKNEYEGHYKLVSDELTKKVNLTKEQILQILQIITQKEIG